MDSAPSLTSIRVSDASRPPNAAPIKILGSLIVFEREGHVQRARSIALTTPSNNCPAGPISASEIVRNHPADRLVRYPSICELAADLGGFPADANHVAEFDRVDRGIARAGVDPIPEDFVGLRHGKKPWLPLQLLWVFGAFDAERDCHVARSTLADGDSGNLHALFHVGVNAYAEHQFTVRIERPGIGFVLFGRDVPNLGRSGCAMNTATAFLEHFLADAFVLQRKTNRFYNGPHGDWGVGVT